MFLGETRYLEWANANFPNAAFDLAVSGEPTRPATGTTEHTGATLEDLAQAIARHNARPVEEVSMAQGASHGLFLAYAALLAPNGRPASSADEVLVEAPHYEPLSRIPESLGARVSFFERRPEENYAIDIPRILAQVTGNTRVVALTNLHNPTGMRTPDETLRTLAAALAERSPEASLLVDEAYASFDARCDDRGIFMHSARNLGDNVVAISTLTKTFGYGPERIGWVLAAPGIVRAMEKQLTSSMGPRPRSLAPVGVAILSNLADLRRKLVPNLRARRSLCHAWVASHARLSWSAPSEGLFGLVRMPDALDLRGTIERGLVAERVLVAPGEFFGDASAFRLSWARPLEHVREALRRLERVLAL